MTVLSVLLQAGGAVLAGVAALWMRRERRRLGGGGLRGADLQTRRDFMRRMAGATLVATVGGALVVGAAVIRIGLPRWILVGYVVWGIGFGLVYLAIAPRLVRR